MIVFNQIGKGTYWRAFYFGRGLVKRGHSVTLLAMSPQARLQMREHDIDGIKLVETPDLLPGALRSGWDLWDTLRRSLWIKGKRYDIVHAFESRPVVIYPALLGRYYGARLVLDWCDWFGKGGSVEERPNPLMRAVLRPIETYYENHFRTRAHGTTVINKFLFERAVQFGVDPASILLIRNGSDACIEPTDQLSSRERLGLPTRTPLIGFVGGTYSGDAQFMASAFTELLKASPDARLVLVGAFNRDIESWIKKRGATIRTGRIAKRKVYEYLAACDLCWLPLQDTGANRGRLPLKLNDYMTAGRPVVATAVGDLAEVIPMYGIGIVTPPNPAAFARETFALLNDRTRKEAMGAAARQTAEDVFNWDLLTVQLESFYRQVIGQELQSG